MKLRIENGRLDLELSVGEKLCSLRRSVSVPVNSVLEVKEGLPEPRLLQLRVPGTYIPGVIKAGTYWTREGREFWYVVPGKNDYVTLDLDQTAPFRRIVLGLEVEDRSRLSDLVRA